jgi:hypothetical protein
LRDDQNTVEASSRRNFEKKLKLKKGGKRRARKTCESSERARSRGQLKLSPMGKLILPGYCEKKPNKQLSKR